VRSSFVDFSGDGIEIVERETGEVMIASCSSPSRASNYTYVEQWCARICRRGSAARASVWLLRRRQEIVVPDNLKSG